MKKSTIAVPIVALLVGVGIGSSSGTETEPASKEGATTAKGAEPKHEERVVIKEVPSETIVEKVVEKRIEVKVVPQACLDAIDAARDVARGVVMFTEAAGIYPPLVGRAFQAGVLSDAGEAEEVVDAMQEANAGMDEAAEYTAPVVAAFNKAAGGCKK